MDDEVAGLGEAARQRRAVDEATRKETVDEGTSWYLIDYGWWSQWQAWSSGNEVPAPGPIDNQTLLRSRKALQSGLAWRVHYEAVPRAVWESLVSWYGGSPSVACAVDAASGRVMVEAAVIDGDKPMIEAFEEPTLTCGACFARLTTRNAVGCGRCRAVAYCDRRCQRSHWRYHRPWCDEAATLGPAFRNARSGLENCGNTCFLNSSVQCLRRARPLTRYFLSEAFKSDVNEANPLGTGGKLAREYASTIKRLEVGRDVAVAPLSLIRAIIRKNPDLGGRAQHDAHELLETLLDGIHEDLNRRLPTLPSNGDLESTAYADDGRVAALAWAAHARRNASEVAHRLHGLLRSTLECPYCDARRARFDPFSSLELELVDAAPDDADDPSALSASDDEDDEPLVVQPKRPRLKPKTLMIVPTESGGPVWAPAVEIPSAPVEALTALRAAAAGVLQTAPAKVIIYDLAHDNETLRFAPPACLTGELPDVFVDDSSRRASDDEPSVSRTLIACCAPPRDFRLGLVRHVLADRGLLEVMSVARLSAAWHRDRARLSAWRTAKKLVDIESLDGGDANPPDPRKFVVAEFAHKPAARRRRLAVRDDNLYSRAAEEDDNEPASDEDDDEGAAVTLYVADWPATSRALGRAIDVKPGRDAVPDLVGPALDLFAETTQTALRAANDDAKLGKRRAKRTLARVASENLELLRTATSIPRSFYAAPPVTLEGCLRRFTSVEYLDADNSWYCPTCARKRRARKRIALWRTPDILVITLKRFSPLHGRKLDRPVDFPLDDLDLAPYCAHAKDGQPNTYTLFAVVNHYGTTGYGHYTAFVRDLWDVRDQAEWLKCDDALVT